MNKTKTKLIPVGSFEVTDDSLRISDPCYDRSTWCAGSVKNPKQGTWNAYVLHGACGWGDNRPWELVAIHSNYPESLMNKMTEDSGIDVGVDSGQAGIFSESKYLGDDGGDYGSGGWYDICCAATLDSKYAAKAIDGGCVSMSGYGDGGYRCFLAKDGTTEIIGVKIVFIEDLPKDDEDYNDDEDLDW